MQPNAQAQPDAQAAQAQTRRQITLQEAAQLLDTTVEGVRSRIKRGSLDSIRVSGTVFVLLDDYQLDQGGSGAQAQANAQASPDSALERVISDQQDQIEFLRRELERKDTILMSLVQRVPELEAPSEPRESPENAAANDGRGKERGEAEGSPRRPWWRKMLFGQR